MKQKISEVIPGITVLQGGEDVNHELVKSGNKILVEKPDGTFAQLTFK